jgi:phage/plasmid-associated DNA primase
MEQIKKDDIVKYWKFLAHKKQTEIRVIEPAWKVQSGKKNLSIPFFVSNENELLKTIEKANGEFNVYIGINERKENCKDDKDVELITNVGHDIDAHGSGEDGLFLAKEVALKLKEDCVVLGYKEPLVINSGRGYWIVHHIAPIPNTEENVKRIKEFGLMNKKKYELKPIEFDTTVYNPSRIARVPGTLNISDKDNSVLSYILNNPSGEEDVKLRDDILQIELPEYKTSLPLITNQNVTPGIDSFMNYCLTHEIPKGERHKVISRNMAIYISNHPNRELLKQQYIKIQKAIPTELDNWLKGIDEEGRDKFPYHVEELAKFTKKYKIPFDWKITPEYKQMIAEKKAAKELEKEIINEEQAETFEKAIKFFVDKRDLAKQFLKVQPLYYDKARNWWIWSNKETRWIRDDEIAILNLIEHTSMANTISSFEKNEIIEALKQEGRKNKPKDIKTSWIQFRDKIYDLNTGENFKATSEYFVTNPIPYSVGDSTETPTIDKIFGEWVDKEYVQTLYEILAYCLLPDYPINRLFCLVGAGMNGKCQKKGDKVLMSDGSWKNIEDICIGDFVLSPQQDGSYKFSKVINTHNRFENDVYDIIEKNRERKIIYTCAGNHIVPIIRTFTKRTSKDDSTPRVQKRMLFEYDAEHISKLNNLKSQICSFTTTAVEYNQKDSNINPYCIGAWLGDGHFSKIKTFKLMKNPKLSRGKNGFSHCCSLGITTMDKEIINEFNQEELIWNSKKINNKSTTYGISLKGNFAKELIRLNLCGKNSGNKFIPKECLLSSIEYRKELLSGLIDTDGYISKKSQVSYCTKSKQLAEDIKDLVFSLGGYSSIKKIKKKSQNGTIGNYFNLSIEFKNNILKLRTWKKDRIKNKRYDPRNVAIECIKTNPQEVYGIELDSESKWYITNYWFVTHNSCYLSMIRKFIGLENICSTELDLLSKNRFETLKLYKKLVCLMGETNLVELNNTSIIKKLTGQDLIGFEIKNKEAFDSVNYAKIIIATNSLPTSSDKTIGFYRRWMIIDFPNAFTEKKNILQDIPEIEYNNLANKCIGILKNLLEKREFTNEGTVDERMKRFEDRSNPLDKFIKETTDEDLDGDIPCYKFIKEFNEWAKMNRFRQMTDMAIGLKMREHFEIKLLTKEVWDRDLNMTTNKRIKCYTGLKWKNDMGKKDTPVPTDTTIPTSLRIGVRSVTSGNSGLSGYTQPIQERVY